MEEIQLIIQKLEKFGITWETEHLQNALLEVDQAIKNYCKIDCIPTDLLYVRVNLTVDYVRYVEANKPTESDAEMDLTATQKVGPLTYVITGGVTYGFANNTTNANATCNAHVSCLDTLIHNYINQLNAFRRLVW